MKKVRSLVALAISLMMLSSIFVTTAAAETTPRANSVTTQSSYFELYDSASRVLLAQVKLTATYEYSRNYVKCRQANLTINYTAPGYEITDIHYDGVGDDAMTGVRVTVTCEINDGDYIYEFYQIGRSDGGIGEDDRVQTPIN